MHKFLLCVVILSWLVPVALGADGVTATPPEQLSAAYQTRIRRLDGRVVSCTARQVVAGHPVRVGKWVIVQEIAPESSADPWGFAGWLNGVRAQYGLPAVGYDPTLSQWAAANNAQQASRGMGHYVMGPARRQNSAMGSYASIGGMWLASPAHRAALLDPTIRAIGIAGLGAYWTFNAN